MKFALRAGAAAGTVLVLGLAIAGTGARAQDRAASPAISADEIKSWLNYLASDELDGRANFSEGLGLAAGYIADHLREWGVRPAGDNGSYFQDIPVLGIKTTNRSSVTVEADGRSRTFKDGEGVTFPKNVGGKRRFTVDGAEFVGYGVHVPQEGLDDFANRDLKGKVAVWLGAQGPEKLDVEKNRRALWTRARYATELAGAVASIGVAPAARPGGPERQEGAPAGPRGDAPPMGGRGGAPLPTPDFTTVQRLDNPVAPTITANDEFFEFLFSGAGVKYAELKEKADKRQPLPAVSLKNVRITFDLDADYEVVRTQYTRNVVGIVDGADPALKDTYVAYGAHYDHVGYAEGGIDRSGETPRRQGAVGRVTQGAIEDRVWNGADDDGSGTVALMAIAKAFATGARPQRSLLFVWHAGEERGLWGSRHFVDYPTVPLDRIVAELNMDMVGRNRDDKPSEENTVYLIGSDRISSELHAISETANASLATPMTLDYEMNDPADPEQFYYRSDHYSYAAKGIPVIFYTTGLHPDYHANTDSVEKIVYPKLAHIATLGYETGRRVANLDHEPVRDNKGPRAGKATGTATR